MNNVEGASIEEFSQRIINKLVSAEGTRTNTRNFSEGTTFVHRLKQEGSGIVDILADDLSGVKRVLELLRLAASSIDSKIINEVEGVTHFEFTDINKESKLYGLAKNERGKLILRAPEGSAERTDENYYATKERAWAYKTAILKVWNFTGEKTITGARAIVSIAAMTARCGDTLGFLGNDKADYPSLFQEWLRGEFTTQLKLLMTKLIKQDVSEMSLDEITQFVSAIQAHDTDLTKYTAEIEKRLAATSEQEGSSRKDTLGNEVAEFDEIMHQAHGSHIAAANKTRARLGDEQKQRVAVKAQAVAAVVEEKRLAHVALLIPQLETLEVERQRLLAKEADESATEADTVRLATVKKEKDALKAKIATLEAAAPKPAAGASSQ